MSTKVAPQFQYIDPNGKGVTTLVPGAKKNPNFNAETYRRIFASLPPTSPRQANIGDFNNPNSNPAPGIPATPTAAAAIAATPDTPPPLQTTAGVPTAPYAGFTPGTDVTTGLPKAGFRVYTGQNAPATNQRQLGDEGGIQHGPAYTTFGIPDNPDDLLTKLNSLAPGGKEIKTLQQQLFDAHLLTKAEMSGRADDVTRRAYGNVLQDITAYNSLHPGAEMSPDEYLAQAKKAKAALDAAGGKTQSHTDTRVNLSDPVTAGVLLNKMLLQYNHRGASPQEKADFVKALNAFQQANPATTTSQTDTTTGLTTSSSTVDRTASPSDFAEAYAQSGARGAEGNASRVGTDYYNVALQTIGAGSAVK